MGLQSAFRVASGHNALKHHFVTIFVAPVVVVAMWFAEDNSIAPTNRYSLAESATASDVLVLLAPFLCLAAAIEMQVLKSLWGQIVVNRRWPYVALSRLLPVLLFGVGSSVFVSIMFVRSAWLTDPPGWQYLALSCAVVLAWTTSGAAIGLLFSPVLAYPMCVLLPFIALTVPASGEPLWLRHLSGVLFDCCGTSDDLSSRALTGALIMQIGITLLAVVVIWVRLGPARPFWAGLGALTILGISAIGAAAATVSSLGPIPTQPRSQSELICIDGICLWPEDEPSRESNARAWADVLGAWQRLNLAEISETSIGQAPASNRLAIASASTSPEAVAQSMVLTLPLELASCGDDHDRQDLYEAFDQLSLALARQTSLVDEDTMFGDQVQPLDHAQIESAWRLVNSC